MTDTTDPQTAESLRIPIAHSVRYAARGLPDVPFLYGPGVIRPSEITLTYRAAPDSQLGRVHAYVKGRLWVDEREVPTADGYGQHYDDGLDGWPGWLTEEAGLHDPDAETERLRTENARMRHELEVMYGGAFDSLHPKQPAARTGLRERIAAVATPFFANFSDEEAAKVNAGELAAAVMSVLPPAADRGAVLREAADAVMRLDYMELRADFEYDSQRDAWDGGTIDAAHELRRLADVAQYGDDCEMAASWRRDGFGEDEIAAMLRRGGGEEQQAETQAPCTCAAAGDCFAPSGHYADCPQATPPAVVAEPGKEA